MFNIKFEKALSYLLGGAFVWLLFLRKKQFTFSDDEKVNSAIGILDSCFNSFGTFDSDLEPIFGVLEKMSLAELLRLHRDFGTRYYNTITRKYSLFSFLEGYAVARPLTLSAIMYQEFDDIQIKRIEDIYSSKGLSFPL